MTLALAPRADVSPHFVVSHEAWAYAKALSAAEATPKAYRGRPADVFLIMQAATAIDVPVFAALSGINVVEGKAEAGAELMLALLHRAGHRVRHGGDRTAAWCEITRADDPGYTYRETFDLDDAEQAELCTIVDRAAGKVKARSRSGNALPWETHTRTMLRWRAISQAASYAAPEVLMGVKYGPGEVGGPIDPADLVQADIAYDAESAVDVPTTVDGGPAGESGSDAAGNPPGAADGDLSADDEPTPAQAEADEWETVWREELARAENGESLTNDLVTIAELGDDARRREREDLVDLARQAWVRRDERSKSDRQARR